VALSQVLLNLNSTPSIPFGPHTQGTYTEHSIYDYTESSEIYHTAVTAALFMRETVGLGGAAEGGSLARWPTPLGFDAASAIALVAVTLTLMPAIPAAVHPSPHPP
jgi:hypothetical protein